MSATQASAQPITVTFDLEDPRPHSGLPQRYDRVTRKLLDLLAEKEIRATFFVVAELAISNPALIREIAANHEIALHGFEHTPLTKLTPQQFESQTLRSKTVIEELIGQAVVGFRAPIFSLTPATLWAEGLLAEMGLEYSSSLLPGRHPYFSFAGAPASPFRWPSGLVEIPSPLTQLGPLDLPYLGGVYFRYLPYWFIKRCLASADQQQSLWFYCHPHDFDHGEPFYKIKNTPYWMSLLLWFNRRGTMNKLARLLSDPQTRITPPFADQLAEGMFNGLPEYNYPQLIKR